MYEDTQNRTHFLDHAFFFPEKGNCARPILVSDYAGKNIILGVYDVYYENHFFNVNLVNKIFEGEGPARNPLPGKQLYEAFF